MLLPIVIVVVKLPLVFRLLPLFVAPVAIPDSLVFAVLSSAARLDKNLVVYPNMVEKVRCRIKDLQFRDANQAEIFSYEMSKFTGLSNGEKRKIKKWWPF